MWGIVQRLTVVPFGECVPLPGYGQDGVGLVPEKVHRPVRVAQGQVPSTGLVHAHELTRLNSDVIVLLVVLSTHAASRGKQNRRHQIKN